MSKTAWLFPGQGSQSPGMGRDLAETSPAARAVFEAADDALGFPLSQLCFEGPKEELTLTENTQPAILTVSIAALAALRERGLPEADFVAGHSLGEYSAAVAAGAMDFRDAVQLVRKRGRYMQEAVPPGVGAMAAILGLSPDQVAEICKQAAEGQIVSPANINSPLQIVIAGDAAAVERAQELARQAGAKRVVALAVSAPFHCALMEPAQRCLGLDLEKTAIADARIPLVNNFAAESVVAAEEIRRGLFQQVPNPVRWEESVRRLAAEGVTRFLEIGPGKVLLGLLRGIDRSLEGAAVGDAESLEKALS
ncbi:MAG: ACP S-malonyltransferase [Acidobacteria bacterium]|nr:ACP S-malonyltransferase [Acidobacteriota bacterium]